MSSPSQPSTVRRWPNNMSASSAPTTGSIVAATEAGAASIRFIAPKKRRLAAITEPAANPNKPRQAAGDGGKAGGRPQIVRAIQINTTPPTASTNNTFATPYRGAAYRPISDVRA